MKHVREALALTGSALAIGGVQAAQGMPEQTVSPNLAADCELSYAQAADNRGLVGVAAQLKSFHSVKATTRLPNLQATQPDCEAANVDRRTWVEIKLGRKVVGARQIIEHADSGSASRSKRIYTNAKLACGRLVTAKATIQADSPYVKGSQVFSRSASFRVKCRKA